MPKGKHKNHVRGEDHPQSKMWVPICDEATLRRLYEDQAMSQTEIADHFACTVKRVATAMRKFQIEPRRQVKRDQTGVNNHSWKGDDAGYAALHLRVAAKRGRPTLCEICQTTESNHYDWANLTGNYADINDYARLCRSCHWKVDGKADNFTVATVAGGDA